MLDTVPLDCLIIGGGPAGLTAATYLGRFRRRVTVVDKGWSRAEWITRSRNVPGFPAGVGGPVLLDLMRTQAHCYGASIEHGTIDTLTLDADGLFTVRYAGTSRTPRSVLLASGVVENKPPLAHLADAVKRGLIRTCPICDGYEAIDKSIAVLFLRTYSARITLLLTAAETASLLSLTRAALQAVDIHVSHVIIGSVGIDQDGVTVLTAEDGRQHRFDVVYSAFGTTPQGALAAAVGARVDAAGRLYTDEHQQTSVPGLYAAGDLVRGLNQISVAAGEAAIAATAIHNSLPRAVAILASKDVVTTISHMPPGNGAPPGTMQARPAMELS
ncbi:NAD(P)/FAD-dependent oxidoreductase (plasmid) [Polymorphobacter sp. PAMC 29334]|uniref:NAD(P)/FAD-dependent oxidoreductase n=1 Tax=Polymorphobacter sp. PAMC 29334 TaxID=2862331 RepID=UPI001C67C7B3|nr:NAD(P)/FAD-dependent oxidoreductase [Polymorphobacter sp. PAMC 29334]QYE33489.1 NAD(P)/FAD-dependent oxidoreductase [Polymorphobacter sp. PAMC 29334]